MSNQMPVFLLDKNVVRRTIKGIVKVEAGSELTPEESDALTLLWKVQKGSLRAFMTIETFNVLRRFTGQAEVDLFMEIVDVMQAGRYFKRWARRLRRYGFTREDAKVLSLGTFGTNDARDMLGAGAIITFDLAFINNYHTQFNVLQERLAAMTIDLPVPFSQAVLPLLMLPSQALVVPR